MHAPLRFFVGLLALTTATACASTVLPRDDASILADAQSPTDTMLADVPRPPDALIPDVQFPPDSPPACTAAAVGNASVTLRGPADRVFDCSGGRPSTTTGGPGPVITRTAAVVSVRDDATAGAQVTVDFCSPAADCVPMLGTLTVRTEGFTLGQGPIALQPGQFVQIRSRASWGWTCTMQLEITNVPVWDGFPNRVRTDSALLAAVGVGERGTLADAPFGVAVEHIGCVQAGSTCGAEPREQYALAFQGHCRTCVRDPDPVTVYQGSTGVFMIDNAVYLATNLRSFNSGACDDYWNYVWTARETPLER